MNTLKGTHVEFHILQSFPVSCLNRDDVGAPKSAMIGGVSRARVSSQCWKRHVRLALQDLGVKIGVRTKQVAGMLAEACETKGATPEQAKAFGEACAPLLAEDTLYFFSKMRRKPSPNSPRHRPLNLSPPPSKNRERPYCPRS